jgi:hypothetical protein
VILVDVRERPVDVRERPVVIRERPVVIRSNPEFDKFILVDVELV